MIRGNFYDLTTNDQTAMKHLVRLLGANPGDIAADFAVTVHHGKLRLHLSEFLTKNGARYLDVAAGHAASRPLVFDVDVEQLPAVVRPAADGATT